jgi:hypothetical protein
VPAYLMLIPAGFALWILVRRIKRAEEGSARAARARSDPLYELHIRATEEMQAARHELSWMWAGPDQVQATCSWCGGCATLDGSVYGGRVTAGPPLTTPDGLEWQRCPGRPK